MSEEMLEVFPEGNEVSNLRMEDDNFLLKAEGHTKQKRDEVALGQRKRQKEDDIRQEKCLHLVAASWRTQNPEGFYSEDWNEVQQEEDEWQAPAKWRRILQIVFRSGNLEINPVGYGFISSSELNTKGADWHMSGLATRYPSAEKAEPGTHALRLDWRRGLVRDWNDSIFI